MSDAATPRRFPVRFLGRRHFWVLLAAGGVAALAAWRFVGPQSAAGEKAWYVRSGIGLLVLFGVALAFSLRKWSMKLRWARELGMWGPAERAELRHAARDLRRQLSAKRRADLGGHRWWRRADLVRIVRRRRADRRELAKAIVLHRKKLYAAVHPRIEQMWSGLNGINRQIAAGELTDLNDIRRRADDVLAAAQVRGIRSVDILGGSDGNGGSPRVVVAHHRERFGRLEAWLEVHAALGTIACIGVLLHACFHVNSPFSAALVGLSLVVLVSGIAGLVLYRIAPSRLAQREFGIPYEEATTVIADWSAALATVARRMPDAQRTRFVPFLERGPYGREAEALALLRAEPNETKRSARDLLVLAGTCAALRKTALPSRQVDLWLHAWRWVHVPASLVLLALVIVHVLQVEWH